ncbi:hypothetical protein P148_SR1C00001G0152 [candidate division SR1 bacterium RAAC1_SR1_1]|nr:hypothetical protein P148_SR1C00001G0152 [candidate division SR1 bacterium RAAC1_SR1_1]
MGNIFKRIIFVASFIFFAGFAAAQQQPAAFVIQVEPSSFDLNVPVDVTIKAVLSNGDLVKDYEGDVFIDVEGSLDTTDYVVPSEGLYTFVPQDQGIKTFSKGLIIKKAGTFTVVASDITDDSIKGEKTVLVGSTNSDISIKKVTINSPIKDSTEKTEVLEVIGGSSDLPNSPLEIYLNSQLVYQGITSSVGGFTAYLTGLQKGSNSLQAKILDINNVILGESDIIPFTYSPFTDGTFNSIQVLPGNTIKAGTKVTFRISTSDTVTSATIKLSNGRSAPMDLVSAGIFSKEMLIDTEGKIDVSLDLLVAGQKQEYTNISKLIVEKGTKIGKVRIFGDSVYKNKLTLTWEVEGTDPIKYNVTFGTQEDNLNESAIVTKKEIVLEDLTIGQTYYFKIIPLDANGEALGSPSDIIQATVGDISESLCTVQGITVTDSTIGDRHYLTRSEVQNVEKYIIYRSERETSDITKMQKVAEVNETRFEYPFNKTAKQEKYAYYAVQAICKDGKALVMQDIRKVQTGPVESFLLFIFIGIFLYSGYRLSFLNK